MSNCEKWAGGDICGICASGYVGTHPLDEDAWSGSSRYFFTEIQSRGGLHSTIGGEIPFAQKLFYALLNATSSKVMTTTRMYSDPRYRNALSRYLTPLIKQTDFPENSVSIQLGSLYNLNNAFPKHVFRTSYNDGNAITGINSPFFPKKYFSAKRIDAIVRYEAEVANGLDCVFTMSEFLRQSFIHDYSIPGYKVICIGCGLNIPYESVQEMFSQDLSVKDYNSGEILFVAKEFYRKGGNTVIKAFRNVRSVLPDIKLHIVGPAQPVDEFADEQGVIWHGFLNRNIEQDHITFKELYRKCSLFVLPAMHEAFGIAPIESMASGISSIVTGSWALKESVPEGEVGENVEAGNVEELTEKMRSLLTNPDKLRKYGMASQQRVAENYTWRNVVNRLETALKARAK
ncbi:MAG: glycosyltransferase family 4 protein [Planctomycetaceae bacterium]|jgi:glycosyltransferase involved in cell wall biosynthesis|nr:glycosyltransferase family 4 protein [Planctomycetaceae bacterium]